MAPEFQARPGTSEATQGLSLNWPGVPVSMMLVASATNGSCPLRTASFRSMKRCTATTPPALVSRLPAMKVKKNVP